MADGRTIDKIAVQAARARAMLACERERQVGKEGWTPEHDDDDEHTKGELAAAAIAYLVDDLGKGLSPCSVMQGHLGAEGREWWPWGPETFKPKTPLRNLRRAGALILAEIERRLRAGEDPDA